MKTNNVKIANREITTSEDIIYTGNYNVDQFEFEFDSEWDDLTNKTLVIITSVGTYNVSILNNKAILPQEFYDEYKFVSVGVYGKNSNNTKVLSSKLKNIYIQKGAYADGTEPTNLPTQSQWDAYVAQINGIVSSTEETIATFNATAEQMIQTLEDDIASGKYDGKDGKDGADGYTPVKGVDYWTSTDKQEIIAEDKATIDTDIDAKMPSKIEEYFAEHPIEVMTISVVDALPQTGAENTIYLVPNGETTGQNVYDEYLWINSKYEKIGVMDIDLTDYAKKTDIKVTDVQVNGNTIVSNGVATIPLATTTSAGISKVVGGTYGVEMSDGALKVVNPTTGDIDSRGAGRKAINPAMLDYAVKKAMTDGVGEAWTNEEKANAKARMGVQDLDVQINDASIVENGVANIPIGAVDKLGVYALGSSYGITVSGAGKLYLKGATENEIKGRTSTKAILPTNIDDAVRIAMGDGVAVEWSDEESENARILMNAQKKLVSGTDIKTINNESILGSGDITIQGGSGTQMCFAITEDIVTVEQDDTKGVSPWSSSYSYTNITIDENAGIEWKEGAIYIFLVNTKISVASNYRNVRVRIGENGEWKPVCGPSSGSSLAGNQYFAKTVNYAYIYKSTFNSTGSLHVQTDSNTTYAYMNNTVPSGATKIDDNGYGCRYTLLWATTPLSTIDERWSSLCKTPNTSSTKAVFDNLTFYADRHPQYNYSANISAGNASANVLYQDYNAHDARYSVNTSATYISTCKKVFLWLKDFNPEDYSFKASAEMGAMFSIDKLTTKFPISTTGDVYIYFLGWSSSSYYSINPCYTQEYRIYKYTPSTGAMTIFK